MKPSPLPWTADTRRGDQSDYAVIVDGAGNVILDSLNSDAATIVEESDTDENGTWIKRWDDQGNADCQFIVDAVNQRDVLKRLWLDSQGKCQYPPWQSAGGPDECKHGIANGLPCKNCDLDAVSRME